MVSFQLSLPEKFSSSTLREWLKWIRRWGRFRPAPGSGMSGAVIRINKLSHTHKHRCTHTYEHTHTHSHINTQWQMRPMTFSASSNWLMKIWQIRNSCGQDQEHFSSDYGKGILKCWDKKFPMDHGKQEMTEYWKKIITYVCLQVRHDIFKDSMGIKGNVENKGNFIFRY